MKLQKYIKTCRAHDIALIKGISNTSNKNRRTKSTFLNLETRVGNCSFFLIVRKIKE